MAMNSAERSKKLLFCGFMGAGKTTFLKKLQNTAQDNKVLDLDDELFQKLKNSNEVYLGEIINRIGFGQFRLEEEKLLLNLLSTPEPLLIGLGGGTLNSSLLKTIDKTPSVHLIWLNTPLEECLSRIKGSSERPLAQKSDSELSKLYNERLEFYGASEIVLDVPAQSKIKSLGDLEDLLARV